MLAHVTRRDQFFGLGSVRLPEAAKQGPAIWYVGHLHVTVKVVRLRGLGRIYVSADTDDRTFAQIKLQTVQTATGPAIRWSTYDLFVGDTVKTIHGRTIEVSFYNYLQNQGVRPGGNNLRLHVEQYGAAKAGTIVVHADSAIERTRRLPTPLALRIVPLDAQPRVGKTFRIKVTVATKARGDLLHAVSLTPRYDPSLLRLEDRSGRSRLASLHGSSSVTYTFEPKRSGRLALGFAAASNINSSHAGVFVDVLPKQTGWFHDTQHWLGLTMLLAGAFIVAAVLSRRRRSPVRRRAGASSVT